MKCECKSTSSVTWCFNHFSSSFFGTNKLLLPTTLEERPPKICDTGIDLQEAVIGHSLIWWVCGTHYYLCWRITDDIILLLFLSFRCISSHFSSHIFGTLHGTSLAVQHWPRLALWSCTRKELASVENLHIKELAYVDFVWYYCFDMFLSGW